MFITIFWFFILLTSLLVIWLSANKVIVVVEQLARSWHISAFTFSVLVLGTATSLPEISMVLSSTALKAPELAVGNLIGGQVLLLLVVLPLFAISANGLSFKEHLRGKSLPLTLLTIAAPSLALIDSRLHWSEAILMALVYCAFFIISFRTASPLETAVEKVHEVHAMYDTHRGKKILILIACTGLLLFSSFGAITSLTYLDTIWNWPPFISGFIILALGTNLPELALLIRSILKKKRSVALGDYVGSATFNTLLAIIITLINGGVITLALPLFLSSILFVAALGLFWYFGVTDTKLSSIEAVVLLGIYGLLTTFQVFFSSLKL